jgi:glycosyltransferase involved in cell wall biosynthesis
MNSAALKEEINPDSMPVSGHSTRPYRILYFDHTAALGGGEIALLNLVRYIDRRHITPIVVLCSEGPLADRLRNVCEVHILPLPESVRNTKKDSLGWRSVLKLRDLAAVVFCSLRLAKFIVKHDINLIHANSLKADIIGGLAGRLARRPVVWHIRDRIESDYLPKSAVRAFRFLSRFVPSYVIANSQAVLNTLHLPQNRSQTSIPSGVEMPKTYFVLHDATIVPSSVAVDSASGYQVIGLIGRICPWKGQHIFLQAAAAVAQRFPNARFKIVGAALFGEDEYEAKVRRLCTDLALDTVVEFAGFRSNVGELIAGLDVVVHASTTGEPFGQVIVEGMAAGKPVVATNGGGVPEIVVDTVTGFLAPMGDPVAMAEAICKILAAPAMARNMGFHGFMRVRKLFTIERAAEKVKSIYYGILQSPESGRCHLTNP